MQVETKEMVSAREFRRESSHLVNKLQKGSLEKIVLTHHGRVVAVVLKPEVYEGLLDD